jgi:hypothetical protein
MVSIPLFGLQSTSPRLSLCAWDIHAVYLVGFFGVSGFVLYGIDFLCETGVEVCLRASKPYLVKGFRCWD